MFNIGPMEIAVLALVGLIVLGPERLPGMVRDAARMLRQLRDMATGARSQLRNELGPELADLDLDALKQLRALNPRTALTRALLGDDEDEAAAQAVSTSAEPVGQSVEQKPPGQLPLGRGEKAPFDADAT